MALTVSATAAATTAVAASVTKLRKYLRAKEIKMAIPSSHYRNPGATLLVEAALCRHPHSLVVAALRRHFQSELLSALRGIK